MPYSPFGGPILFLLLVLPAIVSALRKPRGGEGRSVKRSTLWAMAGGCFLIAAAQAALNSWVAWTGDAVLAGTLVVLLVVTRKS